MIAQIEGDRLDPSNELLAGIAFKTGFPPVFFRQPPIENFPLALALLYRAKAAVTVREEQRGYRYGQIGHEVLHSLLAHVKPIPLRLPRLDSELPDSAADITRSALGIPPEQPINHLFSAIERGGVVGLALPIQLQGIDAFSAWTGDGADRPILVVSKVYDDGARLRWSIAHELAHLVLHRAISGDLKELEDEANAFASQFLLPRRAMLEELVSPVTLSSLAPLKRRWGVSLAALVNRAHSLGMLTDRQRKYLFQQMSARGWRTREPANLDVPIERPKSFVQLARMIYGDPVDTSRLALDTNLLPSMIESFLAAHAVEEPDALRHLDNRVGKDPDGSGCRR